MGDLADITIITVSYNSMAVLPAMLDSVPDGVAVIVVDNASVDTDAVEQLCSKHGARPILCSENQGFGVACNTGARAAETHFLLFLNPDAVLKPGALEKLLDAAQAYPHASAFNPRILDGGGGLALRRRTNLRPKREKYRGPLPSGDMELPVLSGAAIFVEAKLFHEVGGFDEQIFLYHEDDDLAVRLLKHGPLVHVHDAVVQHLEGHSTERSPEVARFKAYYMARSRVYGKAKHGLPWPRAGTIWRGIRQLFSPVMLVARSRAKNWGFLMGALSTLRDGGRHGG